MIKYVTINLRGSFYVSMTNIWERIFYPYHSECRVYVVFVHPT